MVWAKSSDFTERMGATGPIYTAPDGVTEFNYSGYNKLPDWYQDEIVITQGTTGPVYTAPDGTRYTKADYDAMPETEPSFGEPDPEPDPEPEEGGTDLSGLTATKLRNFMASEPLTDEQAEMALQTALAMVEGYTRGNHKDTSGNLRNGLESVVLTVSARIAANPGQIVARDSAGEFSRSRGAGFTGFTLAELAVLNRYRKRAIG